MRARRVWRLPVTARLMKNRTVHRGQILILAVIFIFMFLLVAVALIDIYHVQEGRAWGYRVAQQAALAGASGTRYSWIVYQPTIDPAVGPPTPGPGGCIDPVRITLNAGDAYSASEDMLQKEMLARGFVYPADYSYEIQVLPDYNGGTTTGWPPGAARLGGGDWSAQNPAVGVYLSFGVHTFMSSIVGRSSVTVHVFAAAEASQPPECPSP